MNYEVLPDDSVESPADYVVVFNGGANHGFVLPAGDPRGGIDELVKVEGRFPNTGERYFARGIRASMSMQSVGRRKYGQAIKMIGVEPNPRSVYEVKSIADGIILLECVGDDPGSPRESKARRNRSPSKPHPGTGS